jgi:cobalt-zinc-cadmium efflux system outer membrane protein
MTPGHMLILSVFFLISRRGKFLLSFKLNFCLNAGLKMNSGIMQYRNLILLSMMTLSLAMTIPAGAFDDFIPLCNAGLSYEEVIAQALDHSLPLKIAATEIQVRKAEEFQSGLYPNPFFTVEIDSFGGTRDYKGWDSSEMTYTLTQLFLLGGKMCAEKSIAASLTVAASLDYEIAKQDFSLEVTQVFIDTYLAQEKLKLIEAQADIVKDSHGCTCIKVAEGKASTIEEKKAEIDRYTSQMNCNKAQFLMNQTRRKLGAFLGCLDGEIPALSYPFYCVTTPPPLQELECLIEKSPEWAKGDIERWTAAATTQLEKSRRYPDLSVTAGVSTFSGFHDRSLYLEFSIPIPIFDRNQGNICRARLQEWQALYQQEGQVKELKMNLAILYSEWMATYQAAKALEKMTNSTSQETMQATQEGYDQGKFDRMTLLDAKKSFLEIKQQYLDALAEYHHKKAEVLRIVGQIATD